MLAGILLSSPVWAQDSPRDLFVAADYACFKINDSLDMAYTEIYYSFFRNQLSFQPDSLGYMATLRASVEIRSDSGDVIDSSSWVAGNRVPTLADANVSNYLINDVVPAQLKPGKYDVAIRLTDLNSGASGQARLNVDVPAFTSEALDLSNLELVYHVYEADGGNFDKAGRKVIPNTRGTFSHDDTIAYFYGEAYNIGSGWDGYSVDIRIYDGNGILYKQLPPVNRKVSAESEAILNGFNVSSFKAGVYNLEVSVHGGGQSTSATKAFEVTPGKVQWQLASQAEELSDFPEAQSITTEGEAKNFRNQILYIATREELSQYDDLSLEAKGNFAKAFWHKRDQSPETPINEIMVEHYRRMRYANEAFATFRPVAGQAANGWKTDLGRVYITYGPPSDEENYPSSLETRPWKRWNYNDVEGGVYFIFIDETGYGDYRLVHSSAQREPKDYNWEQRLTPSTIIRDYRDIYTD